MITLVSIVVSTSIYSQNFGVIVKGSTTGIGVDLGYRVNNNVLIKAGYDQFDYNFKSTVNDGTNSVLLNAKAGIGSISLLTDIRLYKKIYITTGVLFNKFNSNLEGSFDNDMKFGDVTIKKESLGAISWKISPKQLLAPYLGFGIGDNLNSYRKVNLSLELGAFYQGVTNFTIASSGIFSPNSDPDLNQAGVLNGLASDYKLYPVVKINLGIRLFSK